MSEQDTARPPITLEDISNLLEEMTVPDNPDDGNLWSQVNGIEVGVVMELANAAYAHQNYVTLQMFFLGESVPPEATLASMFMLGWEAHKKFGE